MGNQWLAWCNKNVVSRAGQQEGMVVTRGGSLWTPHDLITVQVLQFDHKTIIYASLTVYRAQKRGKALGKTSSWQWKDSFDSKIFSMQMFSTSNRHLNVKSQCASCKWHYSDSACLNGLNTIGLFTVFYNRPIKTFLVCLIQTAYSGLKMF